MIIIFDLINTRYYFRDFKPTINKTNNRRLIALKFDKSK